MLKYLNTALGAAALSLTLGGMPQAAFAQDSAEPIIIPTHNWSSQVVMAYVIGGIFQSIGDTVEYVPADTQAVYEAIRNGADPAEIQELMEELRAATEDYMQLLAEEAQRNPDSEMAENQQRMQLTGDQIQEMMDEIQRLMEEGRMAERDHAGDALQQIEAHGKDGQDHHLRKHLQIEVAAFHRDKREGGQGQGTGTQQHLHALGQQFEGGFGGAHRVVIIV
mgnify:CR=1 FL=1